MNQIPKPKDPIWIYPTEAPDWRQQIVEEFNLHPVTAQILVSRGFNTLDEINHYLYAKLPDLHPPHLFADMPAAVERVCQALEREEGILIYGDNDVDGMTGTALLTEFLRRMGGNVLFYVANRNSLRQSVILDALHYGLAHECKLIITVDCGITSTTEIEEILNQHVDVIITDHHEPTDRLPRCCATLNPKLKDSNYPNRDLTGVGVAFKFAHAVTNRLVSDGILKANKTDLKSYLDLVALGTISDMGALLGENRILVRYGLKELRQTQRIGLSKLLEVCDLDTNRYISAADVASKIAPRLNSLGRIADPAKGVELLLCRNARKAEDLALELDLNNQERQKIERGMAEHLEETIIENPSLLDHKAIVVVSDQWHPGVIAILTTRLSKSYNRPVVLIAIEDGIGKGSMRSIPAFPLLPPLKDNADLLLNFGGHDFAAGLTIEENHIDTFVKRFLEAADRSLEAKDVAPKLYLDAGVKFSDLTFDFMESLRLLEPFGNENQQPLLYCKVTQAWPPKVVGKTHLKLYLENDGRMLEGIAFGMGHDLPRLRRRNLNLELAFSPQVNLFQNKASIQLLARDYHIL
ncbi:MAG: single-stranded-DNA-specific exonuclease RecJ [Waddliaceae bacterium]|nr:single-stranded-DNA-specific exonuclease RecJ [Waddliaceae bacterium]